MDPIISQPDDYFVVPEGLTAAQRAEWLVSAAYDYVNLHSMVWPATDADGRLVPPPSPHVLDHLARAEELVDEERSNTTLAANTVSVVGRLPNCDGCGGAARYDALIDVTGRRAGAFLCGPCYQTSGSGQLGQGDVYLMLKTEVPDDVKQVCNQIRAGQGKAPLFGGSE
jgi:hypothetical protein